MSSAEHESGTGQNGNQSSVEFDAENAWVNVRVVGEIEQRKIIDLMREARDIAERNNCHRILIDIRKAVIRTSFIKAYMVAKKFSELTGLDQRFRCAFLYDAGTYPKQRADTMITVTRNWDVTQMQAFERFDEAAGYLKSPNPARDGD